MDGFSLTETYNQLSAMLFWSRNLQGYFRSVKENDEYLNLIITLVC